MVNGAIKYNKEEIIKNMNNVEFQICNKIYLYRITKLVC
jgi:hypothetical protein